MQFAQAAGARVIVTSSSDQKLQRVGKLGAFAGINYQSHPNWEREVLRLTGGRGVNHVIEIGGLGTLSRSFEAIAPGGKVALIGFLAGGGEIVPFPLMMKGGALQGIGVGSTVMFEDLNRAIEANRIQPVIDRVFPFEEAPAALRQLASGDFVGKIVITV
jgi:NADPH:quinone reductase-like Zn-dependent oxidoreductase